MANLFDVTFLQSTLTPVASGLSVKAFQTAPLGLSYPQMLSFSTANTPAATGTTDTVGHCQLSLASGVSTLYMVTGYSGVYGTPTVVSPATGASVYEIVYPVAPLTQVFGTVIGANNAPQAGVTVTANLNASGPVLSTNLVLSLTSSTTTDANGYWTLSLIPNDLIVQPKNTLYTFVFQMPAPAPQLQPFFAYQTTIKAHGASISKAVEVPNVPTVDFATL